MSQNNPKYKRLESLLSDAKQVDPDPNQRGRKISCRKR